MAYSSESGKFHQGFAWVSRASAPHFNPLADSNTVLDESANEAQH
jgi:hypothetical protein